MIFNDKKIKLKLLLDKKSFLYNVYFDNNKLPTLYHFTNINQSRINRRYKLFAGQGVKDSDLNEFICF